MFRRLAVIFALAENRLAAISVERKLLTAEFAEEAQRNAEVFLSDLCANLRVLCVKGNRRYRLDSGDE